MRFFEPTKKFLQFLTTLAGDRPIIDCGCGEGHVTKALLARGAIAYGVDLYNGLYKSTMGTDATTFQFPERSIVIFCRPCHSDWVEKTIKQARRSADVILYIGLEHNFDTDLGDYADRFRKIGYNAGKDREEVWFMTGINDLVRWALVKTSYWKFPYWVEDEVSCWINNAGGRCPKSPKDKILARVTMDGYDRLDHKKTGLYLDHGRGNSGWLEPSGKMWHCESCSHNAYADLILRSADEDLLDDGWCRVYGQGMNPSFFIRKDPTAEQRNYLKSNGYSGWPLDEDDLAARILTQDGQHEFSTKPALQKVERTGD